MTFNRIFDAVPFVKIGTDATAIRDSGLACFTALGRVVGLPIPGHGPMHKSVDEDDHDQYSERLHEFRVHKVSGLFTIASR